MHLKFAIQLRFIGATLVLFVILTSLSGLPASDSGHVNAWLAMGALLPLIGLRAIEANHRRLFADNEATRFVIIMAARTWCI
jgi:hypothetical protein